MRIDVKMSKKGKQLNCPNCGAPITGDRCEYCGTLFIDYTVMRPGEPFLIKFSPDGERIFVSEVYLESVNVRQDNSDMICSRDIDGRLLSMTGNMDKTITVTYRVV